MGFIATELAQGTIAAGSTGDNTIYTAPGATTAHVIHMTLDFANAGDSAVVKAGPSGSERPVASANPSAVEIADMAASRQVPEAAGLNVRGTIGNKMILTGGKIIVNKSGSGGAIQFSVSGYEITI